MVGPHMPGFDGHSQGTAGSPGNGDIPEAAGAPLPGIPRVDFGVSGQSQDWTG